MRSDRSQNWLSSPNPRGSTRTRFTQSGRHPMRPGNQQRRYVPLSCSRSLLTEPHGGDSGPRHEPRIIASHDLTLFGTPLSSVQ